eukprot:m.439824 g.439824  ORF g.439824 m.439824 type:complete len:299 (+) comp18423_c0_seq1:200-1096(+)
MDPIPVFEEALSYTADTLDNFRCVLERLPPEIFEAVSAPDPLIPGSDKAQEIASTLHDLGISLDALAAAPPGGPSGADGVDQVGMPLSALPHAAAHQAGPTPLTPPDSEGEAASSAPDFSREYVESLPAPNPAPWTGHGLGDQKWYEDVIEASFTPEVLLLPRPAFNYYENLHNIRKDLFVSPLNPKAAALAKKALTAVRRKLSGRDRARLRRLRERESKNGGASSTPKVTHKVAGAPTAAKASARAAKPFKAAVEKVSAAAAAVEGAPRRKKPWIKLQTVLALLHGLKTVRNQASAK